ncbi:MAG: hypothetical protein ACE5E6_08020 [Phycisphaerae bacterium]
MAKKSRPSVLKRQREIKKAERAAQKREKRARAKEPGSPLATPEDLAAYGLLPDPAPERSEPT